MNLLVERSLGGDESLATAESIHVFVAYDNFVARQSAQQTAIRLAEKSSDGCTLEWTFKSFDDLRQSILGEEAARIAARAEMVVFATADGGDLPFPLKVWIERWLARKGNAEGALLALAGRDSQAENGSTPAQYYLGGIAREAGINYLEGRFELPATDDDHWGHGMSARAIRTTVLMEEMLRLPPPPHWGINE